jgi:hypothetical protein
MRVSWSHFQNVSDQSDAWPSRRQILIPLYLEKRTKMTAFFRQVYEISSKFEYLGQKAM